MARSIQSVYGQGPLHDMTIDWKRAVFAGIAATVVFDVIGLLLTGRWGVPMLLGAKLGIGLAGGAVAHYTNGALLAVIYAGIAPSLWGPDWARALTYITVQTPEGLVHARKGHLLVQQPREHDLVLGARAPLRRRQPAGPGHLTWGRPPARLDGRGRLPADVLPREIPGSPQEGDRSRSVGRRWQRALRVGHRDHVAAGDGGLGRA